MTNVISLASRRAVLSVQASAQSPAFKPASTRPTPTSDAQVIERLQGIENALSTALYFIRQPYSATMLQGATGRTNRALTLLKNACSEAKMGGAA